MAQKKPLSVRKADITKQAVDFVRKLRKIDDWVKDEEIATQIKIVPISDEFELREYQKGINDVVFLEDDPNFNEESIVFFVPDDYSSFREKPFYPGGGSGVSIWRNDDMPNVIKKGYMIVQVYNNCL